MPVEMPERNRCTKWNNYDDTLNFCTVLFIQQSQAPKCFAGCHCVYVYVHIYINTLRERVIVSELRVGIHTLCFYTHRGAE